MLSWIGAHEYGTQFGPTRIVELVHTFESTPLIEGCATGHAFEYDAFNFSREEMLYECRHQRASDATALQHRLSCHGRDVRMWREVMRQMRVTAGQLECSLDTFGLGNAGLCRLVERIAQSALPRERGHGNAHQVPRYFCSKHDGIG